MEPQQPAPPDWNANPPGQSGPPTPPPPGQWGPPKQWGPPPPQPPRPGAITTAAIILIVLGVLVALIGVLFLLGGALFGSFADAPELRDQLPDISAAFGGVIATVGGLVLAYGVLQVATGIYVLPGRSWARITGMILATLGAIFGLLGLLPADGRGMTIVGVLISAAVVAGYLYVIWALATNGSWFAERPR